MSVLVLRNRLNLRHQVGLFHVGQLNFQSLQPGITRTCLLSRSPPFQSQPPVVKTLQPPFEMLVSVDRIPRLQLHFAAHEALVVGWPQQFAIQPRRRNLQQIRVARNYVLYIEDRPDLPAQVRAILVSHAARLVGAGLGDFINHDAKHARLAPAAQFDFNHLQTAAGGHSLHNRAHLIDLKSHETNKLSGCWGVAKAPQTKKWACAHWCAPPKSGTTQQFPRTNIRRSEPKDKRGSAVFPFHSLADRTRFKKRDANQESSPNGPPLRSFPASQDSTSLAAIAASLNNDYVLPEPGMTGVYEPGKSTDCRRRRERAHRACRAGLSLGLSCRNCPGRGGGPRQGLQLGAFHRCNRSQDAAHGRPGTAGANRGGQQDCRGNRSNGSG